MHSSAFRRVLILSPHTDDAELGCGGTIAKLCERGADVRCVAFSAVDLSKAADGNDNVLEGEMRDAMRLLGVKPDRVTIHGFEPRRFPEQRQEILQVMVELSRAFDPDLVLMPNPRDLHQDHAAVAHEGLRAFKRTTILSYEEPWNSISFDTEAFSLLEERHVAAKVSALHCYASQRYRSYLSEEFLRGWATTRGVQAGVQFAECFEVPRLMVR
jgi:LmbE family N-acetylglucosaminyl deacetylase